MTSKGRIVLLALHYDDDECDSQPTLEPIDPLLLHKVGYILDKNKIHQKILVSIGTNGVLSFTHENGNNIDIDNNTEKNMRKTKKTKKRKTKLKLGK